MKVAYSGGEHEVNVGDVFTTVFGNTFEVAKLPDSTTYGPSGLGGTPCFPCKQLDGDRYPDDYYDSDGLISLCGDSIAAALAAQPSGEKHE